MLNAASLVGGEHGRVLVVDDDHSMCETLAAGLVRRGFGVAWRTSALEGLTLVENERFDAIVTDVNLGAMNGLVFCARALVLHPGMPIILTTGFGTPDIAVLALAAGAFEFLAKPFTLESLRLALMRAVRRD